MKIISNVGLMWLPVSIWQMLRGSSLVFTAILTVTYRKRRLFRFEWIGIAVVIVGLLLLGVQAIVQGQSENGTVTEGIPVWRIVLGIVFVITSMGLEAFKTVLMEKMLNDTNMHSLAIIAWQGFWGVLLITFIILPAVYFFPGEEGNGVKENTLATLYEISRSVPLMINTAVYVLSMIVCNVFAAYLITVTSALTRIILEQFRALTVWVVFVFIYYVIDHSMGERWTLWSYMELGAFVIMTVGIVVYSGAVTHPCVLGPAYLRHSVAMEREGEGEGEGGEDESGNVVNGSGGGCEPGGSSGCGGYWEYHTDGADGSINADMKVVDRPSECVV